MVSNGRHLGEFLAGAEVGDQDIPAMRTLGFDQEPWAHIWALYREFLATQIGGFSMIFTLIYGQR